MATKRTDETNDAGSRGGIEKGSGESGESEIQAAFDDAAAKGFFGESPDKQPNESYTLQGVTANRK